MSTSNEFIDPLTDEPPARSIQYRMRFAESRFNAAGLVEHWLVHDEMASLDALPLPVRESVVRFPLVQATKRFVADAAPTKRAALSRTLEREVIVNECNKKGVKGMWVARQNSAAEKRPESSRHNYLHMNMYTT